MNGFTGLIPLVAALCGAIVGSLMTSVLSHLATARRELRQSRLRVLMALMAGRGDVFSQDVANNINIIPVLFWRNARVRGAQRAFCEIPNGPRIDLYARYNDLVLAVARALGFSKHLSAIDIELGFYPNPSSNP